MAGNSLMPVIVGGAIALAGVIVSSGISLALYWLQLGAEKKKRRAEKFEELVSAVYEFDHWLGESSSVHAFGAEKVLPVSPLAKLQAISAVYFPQFNEEISEIKRTSAACVAWMTRAGVKRLKGEVATMNEGFDEVYDPYWKTADALLEHLRRFAESEFSS